MANPTLSNSGTQTAVITTEHSLCTETTAGTYQLEVDLSAMVDGDVVELRAKHKTLAGGTQRAALVGIFYGAQPSHDLLARSDYIANTNTDAGSVEFSLKQPFGTGRAFPWASYRWA